MLNVAMIGFGNAGQRFNRAIELVNKSEKVLEITCISDSNKKILNAINCKHYTLYEDYQEMLLENKFDLIFIATNDDTHFDIFKFIAENGISYRKIVCEKPLVNNKSEIAFLRENFHSDSIAVHFVERYSDATLKLSEYITKNKRKVKRVFFDWSKFRLNDPRPTIGVFSEITHPLDLALFLSNRTGRVNAENISTCISQSDYHTGGLARPDSITVTLRFENDLIISGISSYLRSKRTREIEFILANENGEISELAVLEFDKPLWDFDFLDIYDISASQGNLVRIYEQSNEPRDDEQHGLSKICKFIHQVVKDIDDSEGNKLADMEQGLCVQEIVLSMAGSNTTVEQQLFKKVHENVLCARTDQHCGLNPKDENN